MAVPTPYFQQWGPNNNTYNQIIDYIRTICSNHEMNPFCDFGPIWNINARNDITFPLVWIEPTDGKLINSVQGVRVKKYSLYIWCLDRINKGDQNFPPITSTYQYQEIISDTAFLLETIIAEIRESEWARLNYFILDSADDEMKIALEVTDENTNGWRCKMNFRIPDIYNPCNIPINPIPLFPPDECVVTYVDDGYVDCGYVA